MNLINLKNFISKKYKIVCFEDMANLRSKNRAIFDLLKTYRKEQFEDNERLVFYTSENPEQDFLNHIKHAIHKIDIGNFFFLIVTPYDLKTKLIKSVGNKEQPISSLVIKNLEKTLPFTEENFIKNYSTLCAFPFININLYSSQNIVQPCCKYKGSIGDANKNTLHEIFQGNKIEQIRNDLQNGIESKECEICFSAEKLNQTSLRQYGLQQFGDLFEQKWFDEPKRIRTFNFAPSNLCNFNCRICSPVASSKIAVEEFKNAKTAQEKIFAKHYIQIRENENHINDIINNLQYVENLHILGGEPLKWPKLNNFLDKILESKYAKNIKIDFNTNGSVFPDDIINKLYRFKKVEILLSIDDIFNRFELQRGGEWEKVYLNIINFLKLKSEKFIVKIALTINTQNVLYLDESYHFWKNKNAEIIWWYLESPYFLSIDRITKKTKDLVFEKYKNHPDKELQALSTRVYKTDPVNGKEFIEYMEKLDLRRNQNSNIVLKEIMSAMREN